MSVIPSIPTGRLALTVVLATIVSAFASSSAHSATAATLCVSGKPGCFATIQAAVDAAETGDTIQLAPGTFQGGVTILKDIDLVGAGAGATTIDGGGPVITIGEFMGAQPTVSISRVTISGGLVDSDGVAAGGGVSIPFSGPGLRRSTVEISDSVVTGNRVAPAGLFPAGAFCGATPCAVAWGGGIDNSGNLTLTNTRLTDNVAGSTPTDGSAATIAQGGGIRSHPGATLTLDHSVVAGNRAAVSTPNGQFSDGGGIASNAVLTMEDTNVSGNVSSVTASVPSFFPFDVQQEANAGGIYLSGGSSSTISDSGISGNRVDSSNAAGDVEAEAGGIDSDGSLLVVDSHVDHNTVTGSVPASSGFLAEADGAGLQIQGATTLRRTHVTDNSLSSTSATGTALGSGGGLFNLGASLTLEDTVVAANSAAANGIGGVNLGGGIGNVQFFGPPPALTLTDSVIVANRIAASSGIASQGAGLFNLEVTNLDPFTTGNPFPVTSAGTVIEGNRPDDCAGC
jgi:hypothetical protein